MPQLAVSDISLGTVASDVSIAAGDIPFESALHKPGDELLGSAGTSATLSSVNSGQSTRSTVVGGDLQRASVSLSAAVVGYADADSQIAARAGASDVR
jgi:hypothetical protein